MLGYALKRTHMLSFDTNLAGELATTWGGEKEQRRQGYQREVLPGALSARPILRMALVEAASALTGSGGGEGRGDGAELRVRVTASEFGSEVPTAVFPFQ